MKQAFQIRPRPFYRAEKPERNDAYLRFIKRFGCASCGGSRLVDAAHTGAHGIGQKASDKNALPLCRKCHELYDQDPQGFASAHKLNIPRLIQGFNQQWEARQRRTA